MTGSNIVFTFGDQAEREVDALSETRVDVAATSWPAKPKLLQVPPLGGAALESFCAPYKEIELRPQQRLPYATVRMNAGVIVRSGALSVDTMSGGNQRQILDFLMPSDLLLVPGRSSAPTVSFRALTKAVLIGIATEPAAGSSQHECLLALFNSRLAAQHARTNLHLLMLGRLEAEARAASFLLAHALRHCAKPEPDTLIPVPMSRDDIADYLAMNADTLSRIMARFEENRIIRRKGRHSLWIKDIEQLNRATPIAHLIRAMF